MTNTSDAPSLEQRALSLASQLGVSCELIPHAEKGARTDDAARVLSRPAERILKFIVLKRKSGAQTTVGVIIRGNERIDVRKVQAESGVGGLSFADADFVRELTGFAVGGVPPVAIALCDVRLISASIGSDQTVVGGGGHDRCGMAVREQDLLRLPSIRSADIVQ